MSSKMKRTKGRIWMQWTVSAAPLDDTMRIGGQFPACEKNTDDNFFE